MKRHILIDKLHLLDAIGTLDIADGKVDIADVIGVINCMPSWLTNVQCTGIEPIISKSQERRIAIQLQDKI